MDLATLQELLNSALTPLIALLTGGLGAGGWFSIKTKTKARVSIDERTQLSRDQYQLIAELRDMIKDQKKDSLEQKKETQALRVEIQNLQEVNIGLIRENAQLSAKITELNARLDSREQQQQIQINVKGE